MNLGCWNSRNLYTNQGEAVALWRSHGLDIIAVQETWENSVRNFELDEYAWEGKILKPKETVSERGVGFAYKSELEKDITFLYVNNPNIMALFLTLYHGSRILIINCYFPNNGKYEYQKMYNDIIELCGMLKKNEV